MDRILSIKAEKAVIEREAVQAAVQYPLPLQPKVLKAFESAAEEDFEQAVVLCNELLETAAVPDVRMLLGTCYFRLGDMAKAEKVFAGLVSEYPMEEDYRIYHGMTNYALGLFEESAKELGSLYPPSRYLPFYYTSYGDSLQQLGKLKESREVFYKDVEYFERTGVIVSAEMLDGAFQNLLYLDIALGNGKYQEDMESYYEFLDQIEMDEKMQKHLAGSITYFCGLMSNKWYRPLFLEFITHIRNRGFLEAGEPCEVLESAFASWESFQYHEDRKISVMMEQYLCASYERKYTMRDALPEAEKRRIKLTALTYDWYLCQYAPEHPEEIEYVREQYPYTYVNNEAFFEKVLGAPQETAEKTVEELHSYVSDTSREEFEASLWRAYKNVCGTEKEPAFVYDGVETYRRIQPKVGRNDPCPCGSGKKYKKCCGR